MVQKKLIDFSVLNSSSGKAFLASWYIPIHYPTGNWKCTPEKLVANAEQYEYVLEQLTAIEEEGGVWNWVKGKWYDYNDQKENLEEYFVDCRDANEIREGVNELSEIVTNWEEITKLYNQVSQRINAYLNTLEDNQALFNGAKWEDIQIHTINIRRDGTMTDVIQCIECQDIFKGMYVTSQ